MSKILQEFFVLLLVSVLLLRTRENGGREEGGVHGMGAGRLLFCCCDCWEEGRGRTEEGRREGKVKRNAYKVQTVSVAMDVKHFRYVAGLSNLLDIVCAIAS